MPFAPWTGFAGFGLRRRDNENVENKGWRDRRYWIWLQDGDPTQVTLLSLL